MVYLYILQSSADNGYYIGIRKDLERRLDKSNKGGVSSTKNRRPFKLIFYEKFNNYMDARTREIEIKSFKGGNKFRELIN